LIYPVVATLNAAILMATNQINNSLIQNPTTGSYSIKFTEMLYNQSIAQISAGLYDISLIQWGDNDGFTIYYSTYLNGFTSILYTAAANAISFRAVLLQSQHGK
jgi:hypothetical protein